MGWLPFSAAAHGEYQETFRFTIHDRIPLAFGMAILTMIYAVAMFQALTSTWSAHFRHSQCLYRREGKAHHPGGRHRHGDCDGGTPRRSGFILPDRSSVSSSPSRSAA
jgi:hypothetical protein